MTAVQSPSSGTMVRPGAGARGLAGVMPDHRRGAGGSCVAGYRRPEAVDERANERTFALESVEVLAVLERFRAVVGGPVEVRRMKPAPELLHARRCRRRHRARRFQRLRGHRRAADRRLAPPARRGRRAGAHARGPRGRPRDRLRRLGAPWQGGAPALGRGAPQGPPPGVGGGAGCAVLAEIAASGTREIVLLTTDAEAFFASLGFAPIDWEALPVEVRSARQVATQCCASAVCMRRVLFG